MQNLTKKLEYGDYQTPSYFCDIVCNIVKKFVNPTILIEPTCGLGNFINSAIKSFNNIKKVYGIEIDSNYCKNVSSSKAKIFNEDIFNFNHNKIKNHISKDDSLLIIGNPPWVTNSELMANSMSNVPKKSNFKHNKGFESMTGISNFDICEYIILDILKNYNKYNGYIAMLCKKNVVTNIMKNISSYNFGLTDIKVYNIDAKKIFKVNCEACLFVAKFSTVMSKIVEVYDITNPTVMLTKFGWKNDKFYSNLLNIDDNIDGQFPFEWRQGIKHDCSKIMELKVNNNLYLNGNNQELNVESDLIYPLLKSSDLKKDYINCSERYLIVTQRKIKEDTSYIETKSPKLWNYLVENKQNFVERKSSIYNNSPSFSIFGVGDYSFYKFKVAISGFYKTPNFAFIDGDYKEFMLDDTCYFIGFEEKKDAIITSIILNLPLVKRFLNSIAFLDKKRPYTKDILMRIDLKKIFSVLSFDEFEREIINITWKKDITKEDFINYKEKYIDNLC